MECCGQTKPIKKTVVQMQALKTASKFIPGQIYQIVDAHFAQTGASVKLTPCPNTAGVPEVYPFTITSVSGATATVTSGLSSAVLTLQSGAFIENEGLYSSQGNCYIVSNITYSKGAVINIKAYSTSELEDIGFGTFINTAMTNSVYATMWYSLSDDLVYRIIDQQDVSTGFGGSDIEDMLGVSNSINTIKLDQVLRANNREVWQKIAVKTNVSGAALATVTLPTLDSTIGNRISLANCTPTHFVVKYAGGTFGAVTITLKVNGVAVASGVSLLGLDAVNHIMIPIASLYKASNSSLSLIEVQVTATVASTLFSVECYGIKNAI